MLAQQNEELFAEILRLPTNWSVERPDYHPEEKRLSQPVTTISLPV